MTETGWLILMVALAFGCGILVGIAVMSGRITRHAVELTKDVDMLKNLIVHPNFKPAG